MSTDRPGCPSRTRQLTPQARGGVLCRPTCLLPCAPRKRAKHAKLSRAVPVLAAGGLTLALAATDAALAGAASASAPDSAWDRLAVCESGGNWAINTGNGYYGGLQFNLATWRGVGGVGYPHHASREQQIAAANRLHDARGFAPWPACSRKLGLRGDGGRSAAPAPAPVRAPAPAPAPARVATPAPAAAPAPGPGSAAAPAPAPQLRCFGSSPPPIRPRSGCPGRLRPGRRAAGSGARSRSEPPRRR
jgi:hypothetical protein